MRGVEVHPDGLAAYLPQPPERIRVVGDEAGMKLDSDFDPVLTSERRSLLPVRLDFLAPLPLEGLEEFDLRIGPIPWEFA